MARRRKEDGRVGSASRGMVRRWSRFFSHVRPRVSPIARGGLIGATSRGQPWTSAVALPPERHGLIAWRMAVLSTFRAPSLCRHVHRAFLRSVWLDVPSIIAATACHQRNDQIPPDLVVKWQAIDIADVIFSLIWRRPLVHTGGENRKSRGEPLAPSTAHRFTT